MRRRFRTRRFRTTSEPLAFAARLRSRRDLTAQVPPVGRVLRRLVQPVLQRLWMPVYFALQVMQRAAAPWNPPLRAPSRPPASLSPGTLRERFHLCTRLLERSLRVLQVQRGPMLVSIAPAAPAEPAAAPAPARVVMMQRVERERFFPRVPQVLARVHSPAASRADAPPAPDFPLTAFRPGPRPGTPRSAIPAAASLAPAELARVTDHVIRELDQRVLSYRERTGQV